MVRLTGAFYSSGDANLPQVTVNATAHGLTAGEYVSTNNMTNSNTEGVNFIASTNTNNFTYYPKRSPSLAAGYPLNQTDSAFRQAFAFSGADIDIQLLEGASAAYTEANTTINYINSAGSDYAVGDTLLVAGTDIGGASPANDLVLTVVSIDPQSYPGDATPGVFTLGLRSFTAQVIKQ